MKKKYSKPYLTLESFQLDAAIASACSLNPLNQGVELCTYWDENGPKWEWEANFGYACAGVVLPSGDIGMNVIGTEVNPDGVCYHSFVDGIYLES